MSGEIVPGEEVVIRAGTAVLSGMIQRAITGYRRDRAFSLRTAQEIRLRAEMELVEARQRAVGELARANISEIAKTMRHIENEQLQGQALDYAMEQLSDLHRKLKKNLDGFDR